jgi:hypothetical protein
MIAVTMLMANTVPKQYDSRKVSTPPIDGNARAGAREGVPSQEKP